MIDYKRIQELDKEYDGIVGTIWMEERAATESEKERMDAIISELRKLDRFGISETINSFGYH